MQILIDWDGREKLAFEVVVWGWGSGGPNRAISSSLISSQNILSNQHCFCSAQALCEIDRPISEAVGEIAGKFT